jgi:hypothetical protein
VLGDWGAINGAFLDRGFDGQIRAAANVSAHTVIQRDRYTFMSIWIYINS